MRRAYFHRRTTSSLGGGPVGRDVPGGVQVRVLLVPAPAAPEQLAAGSVVPRRVPAHAALLRRVAGVHEHHRHPMLRRLVQEHLLLAAERPRVHPSLGVALEAASPGADVRKVLEGEGGAAGASGEDLRRGDVIAPGPKPLPLLRARSEASLSRLGAFGLEAVPRAEVSAVDLMPGRVTEELAAREGSRDHDTTIATDNVGGGLGVEDLLGEREGEDPVGADLAQTGRVAVPVGVALQVLVRDERALDALGIGRQFHRPAVVAQLHGAGVIGDGASEGTRSRDCLALGRSLAQRRDRAHRITLHVADELRLESVGGAQRGVEGMVELDRALDLGMLEGVGSGLVVGGRDPRLQSHKGVLLVGGDQELATDGSSQQHDHVGSDYPIQGQVELGHCLPEGSLLPGLKAGVSASFQDTERYFR